MSALKSMELGFSILPLLVHSHAVPPSAKSALVEAQNSPPEQRIVALASAARVLHQEAGLECSDALEIVGLEADGDGCA